MSISQKNHLLLFLVTIIFFCIPPLSQANTEVVLDSELVREQSTFYGLAFYLNQVQGYWHHNGKLTRLKKNQEITLSNKDWFAISGRFKALIIQGQGVTVRQNDQGNFAVLNPEKLSPSAKRLINKNEQPQLRYAHLWRPLALLAITVEWTLVKIQYYAVSNWGLTLIVFALLLKLLLMPVALFTIKQQRIVSKIQAQLNPQLTAIKAKYDGEAAHHRIMAAHKNLNITPFYSLKPSLALLIQIPILIAVFNALAEMPQFLHQSFLWVNNLSYVDAFSHLPWTIPMLGNSLNLLPLLMAIISLLSTITHQNRLANASELRTQKYQLYAMAFVFLILFYPFPAIMVLYWALANTLQLVQQQFLKI